jgi:hypothetical protein
LIKTNKKSKYSPESIEKYNAANRKGLPMSISMMAALIFFAIFRHGLFANVGLAILFVINMFFLGRYVLALVSAQRSLRDDRLGRRGKSQGPTPAQEPSPTVPPRVKLRLFSGRGR